MADERPAKRRRFTSDIVTIKVGTDHTDTFKISSEVLKKSSPFFKAALDKKWKEGQSLQIELPKDEPDVFEAYLVWINGDMTGIPDSCEGDDFDELIHHLIKLYVFGEKVQNSGFCNAVMDAMIKLQDSSGGYLPAGWELDILYEGTPDDSPARAYYVQLWAHFGDVDEDYIDDFPVEFTKDLALYFATLLPGKKYESQFADRKKWYKPT